VEGYYKKFFQRFAPDMSPHFQILSGTTGYSPLTGLFTDLKYLPSYLKTSWHFGNMSQNISGQKFHEILH